MPDNSLPNGPASPEKPVNVWLDGGLNAVDLVRRLHRAGLELKNEDGRVVLVLRTDALRSDARTRLFEACAVIEAARLAVVSKIEDTDMETVVTVSLEVAARMIDKVAAEMEGL